MKNFSLKDLRKIACADILNWNKFRPFSNVSTDSRNVNEESLFFALKGDKFDGHNFIEEVIAKGVRIVVINSNVIDKYKNQNAVIVPVEDTTVAYGKLANLYKTSIKAKLIAITGSNGKTTTKDILYTLLSDKYKVTKTEKNNNNNIGVPLTILSTKSDDDFIVLEVGTNHPGEVEYSAKIAKPDYAVITNIGESHLEFLKNLDGVLNEKYTLFKETILHGGKIFVNLDDELINKKAENISDKITFSTSQFANYMLEIVGFDDLGRTKLSLKVKNGRHFEVTLPLLGIANARNYLVAVAIATEIGMNLNEIINATSKIASPDKRLSLIELNDKIVINDTYNANPKSMAIAFEVLKNVSRYNKKIAIIGDMFELGDKSEQMHIALAESILTNQIDEVYTIGAMMKKLSQKLANTKVKSIHFDTRKDLSDFISNYTFEDTVVLFKGSRGMKMEDFAEQLTVKK